MIIFRQLRLSLSKIMINFVIGSNAAGRLFAHTAGNY